MTGPRIKVWLFPGLREVVGAEEVEIAPAIATLRGVLDHFHRQYGPDFSAWLFDSDGSFREGVAILLNSRAVAHLTALDTPVADGDQVTILLPVAGG